MIVLEPTKSLIAKLTSNVETSQPQFYITYSDSDSNSVFKEGSNVGLLNGSSEVILLAGPSSAQRVIKLITICNMDTQSVEVNLSILENTNRYAIINKFVLQSGCTLIINNDINVLNPNGSSGSNPGNPTGTIDGDAIVDSLTINPNNVGTGSGKISFQGSGNINKYSLYYNGSDDSLDFIYNLDG